MSTAVKVLKTKTLYFLYNPETMQAVTKSDHYQEIIKQQATGKFDCTPKLAEMMIDLYTDKVISLIPENVKPMEDYFTEINIQPEESVKPRMKKQKNFIIREPIWKQPRSVGLNFAEIENSDAEVLCIKITYRMRKKNDQLLYPEPFYIDREKSMMYPVQTVVGTKVTIIPIEDMRDRP